MSALVLALALLGGVADSATRELDVWITLERDVLVAFERGGEAWESTPRLLGDPAAPRGHVVAVEMAEARLDALSSFIHERYRQCGGYLTHGSREEALYAAARAAYSEALERMPPPVPYTIDNGPVARAMAQAVQEINIRNTITALSAFPTRRHNCTSGTDSAHWIRDQWQALAAGRPDVTVELFSHTAAPQSGWITPQPSVILTIQGTTLPSEVVVLGGHQDSTRNLPQGVPYNCLTHLAPGADDDASGIATLTEAIRVAMALDYQPQRTVKFMAYAAEEVGLRGSNHIAQTYQDTAVNVVGVVQFDMTNYSDTPQHDIVFYTSHTTTAQNAFLNDLASLYVSGDTTTTDIPRITSACSYACSDHASWFERGFPVSFPFEAPFNDHSPFIHSQNDTLATSGGHAQRSVPFAKLAAAYMAELAKGGFTARDAGKR